MAYNLLKPFQILSAQSMAASFTSGAVEISNQDNVGVQLNWTTSNAVGIFGVQVSLDYRQDLEGNIVVAGNWIPLNFSPTIVAASTSDVAYIDLNQLSAPYMRVTYTRTSGTGTVNGFVVAKGV